MTKRSLLAAIAVLVCAAPAAAQLPSGSTAALGMGNNFTAAARGYGAVAWNPALLASSSNTGASMTLLTALSGAGIGPIELNDLADYADEVVPENVKQEWLSRIPVGGGESGTVNADMTWGAAQIGRFGLQVSTSVRTLADLSRDVLQLIMFGNVDGNGDPATLDFAGSGLDMTAFTTLAAGYAHPFRLSADTRLLVGATGKFTIGHLVVDGDDSEGSARADGFDIAFPTVTTVIDPDSFTLNNGTGVGFDVGVALETGPLTVGASVQNVVNTFEWDLEKLRYRPLTLLASDAQFVADTEERSIDEAPDAVRERTRELTFGKAFGLGAAYRARQDLIVSADVRRASEEGILTGPTAHYGAGVEYRPVSWLPLRAGLAAISLGEDNDGYQLGAGLGVNLGGWNLSVSALQRETDHFGGETMFMGTIFATGLP